MVKTTLKVRFSEEDVKERIRALGKEISELYKNSDDKLVMVCVLKSAVIFFADLTRAMHCPLVFDFMRVKSYGSSTESSKSVVCTQNPEINLEGRDVLVVEDIVDTGYTMKFVLEHLAKQNPKSLRVVTLLDKTCRRECEVPVDFKGFEIDTGFVVGFGFDFDEEYRGLSSIHELE